MTLEESKQIALSKPLMDYEGILKFLAGTRFESTAEEINFLFKDGEMDTLQEFSVNYEMPYNVKSLLDDGFVIVSIKFSDLKLVWHKRDRLN